MTLIRLTLFGLAIIIALFSYWNNSLLGLGGALLCLALALRGVNETTTLEPLLARPLREAFPQGLLWLRAHLAFTIGCAATVCGALAVWLSVRNEFSLTANYLWLTSSLLIVLATLYQERPAWRGWRERLQALNRQRALLWEIGGVGGLTLLAFALRAYAVAHYPPYMHGDEGEMGVLALRILEGKTPLAFFGTYWNDHPVLFHYLQASALVLFGKNEVGLRLLSAIFGAACVPCVYGLTRMGWGRLAALVAAWLLTFSHLHIHYSRLGLNNIESVFTLCGVMWLCAQLYGADDATPPTARSWGLCVTIGLVTGLSQYLYYGSRLMPVILAPLLLILWRLRRVTFTQLAVLVWAALLAFAPLGAYYWYRPIAFVNRLNGVSLLTEANLKHSLGPQAQWPNDVPRLLTLQLERNLNFFVRDGDRSAFYLPDVGGFDALTSLLFWLGLGVALTRVRRYHEFAVVTWFSLGLLFGGVLTNDPPNGPRLIVMVPAIFVLGGVFVARLWRLLQQALRAHWELLPALVIAGAFIAYANLETYFVVYPQRAGNVTSLAVARALNAHTTPADRVYFMGAPIMYAEHGVIRFLVRAVRVANLDTAAALPALPVTEGLYVIALPNHREDLQQIAARFPGGDTTSYSDLAGRLLYIAYHRPPRPAP